jgi:hypothetical protein
MRGSRIRNTTPTKRERKGDNPKPAGSNLNTTAAAKVIRAKGICVLT